MSGILGESLSEIVYHGSSWVGCRDTGVRILCYHRVFDEKKDYLNVPSANFQAQMEWLKREGYHTISLAEFFEGKGDSKSIMITFDDGYRDNYENAFPILKNLGFKAAIFCIADRIGQEPYLKLADIKEMHAQGFEFGSHTLSHPNLRRIDQNEKWKEISQSKKNLENIFGFPCDFFCYPFGEFDPESLQFVEKAGYRGACSNTPGSNKKIDAYKLRRTEISGFDSLNNFKKKVAGAYDLLHQGLHWMRRRP